MRTLWFVVPVHGRLPLASVCLRQLRRTCDALFQEGVHATAVVVTDARQHYALRKLTGDLRFGYVNRDNDYTSRKFNDGIELATSPRYNPRPADFVVPIGSDDWVDYRLFCELETIGDHTIVGFQRMSFVREDAGEIASVLLNYRGGSGIRIIPRVLLEPLGYRPADADRKRACDTSILVNLSRQWGDRLRVEHWFRHDRQIVDWKTPGEQLNSYANVVNGHSSSLASDPFAELAGWYPAEAIDEMRDFYGKIA